MKRFIVFGLAMFVSALGATQSASAMEFQKFDLDSVSAELSTSVAGAHPDFTTQIKFAEDPSFPPFKNSESPPYALVKDVRFDLPPGLLANLNAVSTCTAAQFVSAITGEGCPFSSQIGISKINAYEFDRPLVVPVFNVETAGSNQLARFGVYVQGVPAFVDVSLRSNEDYGATAELTGISSLALLQTIETTIWGVPGADVHDTERLTVKESVEGQKSSSPPRSSGRSPEPFLINPTACGGPLAVQFAADSYQEAGAFRHKSAELDSITECPQLSFDPTFSLEPTNHEAGAASGADATLSIPQDESVNGRASSAMRDAVVQLPEGVAISSGAAEGLAACSTSQVRLGTVEPAECPEASKIATAEINSPSLSRPVKGAVYQRTPESGHLTRAWLVIDDLGLHIKIPGEFQLNPANGQITSLFLETPQVPVREFKLHFKGGSRGVLATPSICGTYQTVYKLTPWSGGPDAEGSAPMTFNAHCTDGSFSPHLSAGTENPVAGAFSSFLTTLTSESGEPNLAGLHVTLPPGVLAKLAGVGICPDSAAASGACPNSSRVGSVSVATGFGPSPLWIPQPGKAGTAVYLAGPYKGGPYSLVIVTPAQAGPFDLGLVVVRASIQIDPETARVTVASDQLPQILQGIPLDYRDVRVAIDRNNFVLNPTSCNRMAVTGTAVSVIGQVAHLSSPFQVGSCANLGFAPKLSIRLKGGTKRTAYPQLIAILKARKGDANIAKT